eukprot:6557458-Prymnesium_polylepis.2
MRQSQHRRCKRQGHAHATTSARCDAPWEAAPLRVCVCSRLPDWRGRVLRSRRTARRAHVPRREVRARSLEAPI